MHLHISKTYIHCPTEKMRPSVSAAIPFDSLGPPSSIIYMMKVQKPRSSPVTFEHLNPHALQMDISGALNFWGATRTRVLQASDKSGFQVRRPIKHDHQFEVNSGSDHQYINWFHCVIPREKKIHKKSDCTYLMSDQVFMKETPPQLHMKR